MPSRGFSNPGEGRRIVILGGGYAALAAASTFSKDAPESRITLIAPRKAHIKITHLQETLRYSLRRLCVLYADLGKRFGFRFIRAKLRFENDSLLRWQQRRTIRLDTEEIPFDYLIIATGAEHIAPEKTARILTVGDFCLNQGQTMLRDYCQRERRPAEISVVGGGPTGVQFLFELSDYLRRNVGESWKLRLINYGQRVLDQFPEVFHEYALERMRREGIEFFPNTVFQRQEDDMIVLSGRDGETEFRLPSHLSLLFLGVKPNPFPIETNAFGQVIGAGELLDRIFAAGDCARFAGAGANTLSAQVAVRKGKTVAGNILRQGNRDPKMEPYDYEEQGYFVSLGPSDGIGWLDSKENIITGVSALTIKKAAEAQYSLLLSGIDSYDT
ncbi:MAG TPA: FAD-dependent oxidoreductase [Methylococcaceae bacterium]|nr:FAD-dependent oxidoreductase [Methylococcaceae bacterium]